MTILRSLIACLLVALLAVNAWLLLERRRSSQGVIRVDRYGAVCDLGADDAPAVTRALTAASGRTLVVPSGCKLLISSGCPTEGACPDDPAASFSIASNTTIHCADGSAGFYLARRSCRAGRYPGAYCAGGTNDCPAASASDCVYDGGLSARYANSDATRTFALFVATAGSRNVTIENCGIWTNQADPVQRCVGGDEDGRPCKLECDRAALVPGVTCETDGDCPNGACTNAADCGTGTCNGVPLSPGGAGKVNPIDLANVTHAVVRNVRIYDHFHGDFSLRVGAESVVENSSTASTEDDCTNAGAQPFLLGSACYGAATLAARLVNTQPATSVARGIYATGADALIVQNEARGSISAIETTGVHARVERNTILPKSRRGPGTKVSGATDIKLATDSIAASNILPNVDGIGVDAGSGSIVRANEIRGTGTNGVHLSGGANLADGNHIVSSPVDTLDIGILLDSGTAANNRIDRPELIGIKMATSVAEEAIGNTLVGNADPTKGLLPSGIQYTVRFGQARMIANHIAGFFRGIEAGPRPPGGSNELIVGNRFVNVIGPNVAMGGAGMQLEGNYFNPGHAHRLICDTSCANRGVACTVDADCRQCGSGTSCVPSPVILVGSDQFANATSHAIIENNLIFTGATLSQCTAGPAANRGRICTIGNCATGTCANGACLAGGTACCDDAGGGGVCTARTLDLVRVAEYNIPSEHSDTLIAGNEFLASVPNVTGVNIPLVTTGLKGLQITSNTCSLTSKGGSTCVRMPATPNKVTGAAIIGNNLRGSVPLDRVANWSPAMGRRLSNGAIEPDEETFEGSARSSWRLQSNAALGTVLSPIRSGIDAAVMTDSRPVGCSAQRNSGSPKTVEDATGAYDDCPTGASRGDVAGWESASGRFNQVTPNENPHFTFVVKSGTSSSNVRYMVCVVGATTSGSGTMSGIAGGCFRFDTGESDATSWRVITNDGTGSGTAVALDGGANAPYAAQPFTADTRYVLGIEVRDGTWTFLVNGNTAWSTATDVPAPMANLGFEATVTTLTAAATSIRIAKVACSHR